MTKRKRTRHESGALGRSSASGFASGRGRDAEARQELEEQVAELENRLFESREEVGKLQLTLHEKGLAQVKEIHGLEVELRTARRDARDARDAAAEVEEQGMDDGHDGLTQHREALTEERAKLETWERELVDQEREVSDAKATLEHEQREFELNRSLRRRGGSGEDDGAGGGGGPGGGASAHQQEQENRTLRQRVGTLERRERRAIAEHKRLLESHGNGEALKETIATLTAKVDRGKEREGAAATAIAQRDALLARARRWDAAFKDIVSQFDGATQVGNEGAGSSGSSSSSSSSSGSSRSRGGGKDLEMPPCVADSALELIRSLRLERAVLFASKGRAENSCTEAESELQRQVTALDKLRGRLQTTRDELEDSRSRLTAAERKSLYVVIGLRGNLL